MFGLVFFQKVFPNLVYCLCFHGILCLLLFTSFFFSFFFTKPLQLRPPYVLFRFFKSVFDLSDLSELKNVEIQDADFV